MPALAYGIAVALALLCVAAAVKTPARQSLDVFWATTPWMLLISPLLWYPYTVLVLPLIYLMIANHVARRRYPPWFLMIAFGFLLVWALGFSPGGTGMDPVLLAVYLIPTCGLIILGLSEWHDDITQLHESTGTSRPSDESVTVARPDQQVTST